MTTFPEFLKTAMGNGPCLYQSEFATLNDLPSLVSVGTGCGWKSAVSLGWL